MVEVREKGLFFDSTAKKISFSLRLACPPPSDDSGTPLGQESILFLQVIFCHELGSVYCVSLYEWLMSSVPMMSFGFCVIS